MNIMGIGPLELLVVLVIAFLVLGPDRMGSTARSLGKLVRDLRQQTSGLPRSLDDLWKEPEDAPSTADKPEEPSPGVPRPRRRRAAPDTSQDPPIDDSTHKE